MHRWYRDYNRAARPPPDVAKDALNTLIAWGLLFFFCVVLGLIFKVLGVGGK